MPASAVSDTVGRGPLIAFAAVTMLLAVCCASAASPALRLLGGLLGGVLALVLVAFNGTVPMWEGLVILAVMFLGTAAYRAEHGQSTWRYAAWTTVVVLFCAVGSAYWHGDTSNFTRRGWITAFLLAVLTFGVGLALRHRRIPRPLIWLGTISYSVYLIHPVLLAVSDDRFGRWRQDSVVVEVAFYVVLLPVCVLTFHCVEAPVQRWGRGSRPGRGRPRGDTAGAVAPHQGRTGSGGGEGGERPRRRTALVLRRGPGLPRQRPPRGTP